MLNFIAMLLGSYLGTAFIYGLVAPLLQRGVTFQSCVSYVLLLPFRAIAD